MSIVFLFWPVFSLLSLLDMVTEKFFGFGVRAGRGVLKISFTNSFVFDDKILLYLDAILCVREIG